MKTHLIHTTIRPLDFCLKEPFGPGLATNEARKYTRMEVWGTMFDNSAEQDYCEFRLYNGDRLVKTHRTVGY
jgi:hypothetical protein